MPLFAVEICFTQPEHDRLCAAGVWVGEPGQAGMTAEIDGHLARRKAEIAAVETLRLKSGRTLDLLVFERGTAPWRPFQVDGSTLIVG